MLTSILAVAIIGLLYSISPNLELVEQTYRMMLTQCAAIIAGNVLILWAVLVFARKSFRKPA